MAYGIELFFDAATGARVREIWRALDTAQILSPTVIGDSRPHITMAVCDQIDEVACAERLAEFALATAPFALTLANLGLFPPSKREAVVFAAPTVTATLLMHHEQIQQLLAQATAGACPYYLPGAWVPRRRGDGGRRRAHYLPGAWVPHCTLTQHCPPERVGETIAICRRLPLPLDCRIEAIGIIETRTTSLLSSHILRKNDAGA